MPLERICRDAKLLAGRSVVFEGALSPLGVDDGSLKLTGLEWELDKGVAEFKVQKAWMGLWCRFLGIVDTTRFSGTTLVVTGIDLRDAPRVGRKRPRFTHTYSEELLQWNSSRGPKPAPEQDWPGPPPLDGPRRSKPRLLYLPEPVYPESLQRAGIEGIVVVEALVDVDGSVADARVLKSAGSRPLDESAVESVMRARFLPAMFRDKPEPTWVTISRRFELR
jgi:TonB family protein